MGHKIFYNFEIFATQAEYLFYKINDERSNSLNKAFYIFVYRYKNYFLS